MISIFFKTLRCKLYNFKLTANQIMAKQTMNCRSHNNEWSFSNNELSFSLSFSNLKIMLFFNSRVDCCDVNLTRQRSTLRPFSIAVALPARAERTLLNFLCSCLTCAFFVRLNARGHAMKVELHSTFLACPGD